MPEPTYNLIQDQSQLLTYLQQQYKRITSLEQALVKAAKPTNASMNGVPLTQAQLNQIRNSLSANGVAQFNVQSLLGVLAQPQNASIQTFPTLPDPTNPIYQQNAAIIVTGILYVNNGTAWVAFSVGITSITVSGGATGLTGGTLTGSGTITLGGTLAVASGGTGATTAANARTNLGIDPIATKKSNLSAAVAPTVNDDNTLGYAVGSFWFDTTANQVYAATNVATGAAVWKQLS